jgi:type VI secretion system protein ImpG
MHPRFLAYYNQELQHIREMSAEFAADYPKIAQRLGLEGMECADPYVERLLEGFAYMAARVQLKVDAEFPNFTENLLDMVYPDFLAPTPSMGVVRVRPDFAQGIPEDGLLLPRGTALKSFLATDQQTPCEYRTAHDVTLWPFDIEEVSYLSSNAAVASIGLTDLSNVDAGLRIRLSTVGGIDFASVNADQLPLYLRGGDRVAMGLYEHLLGNAVRVVVRSSDGDATTRTTLPGGAIHRRGFSDEDAVLPWSPRSFQGYRLLREYFTLPERFMFAEIHGLRAAFQRCAGEKAEIIVLFDRSDPVLEDVVNRDRVALYCTPVINLFPKRADRVHLSDAVHEHHVVPDRSRPLDFEVFRITNVAGVGSGNQIEQSFLPFYACNASTDVSKAGGYYTVRRTRRLASSKERRQGRRSTYIGNETFLMLVDGEQAPYATSLRQLSIQTLCTNRDLPLLMPVNAGRSDLTLDIGVPVAEIRFVAGPTAPKPSAADKDVAWKLISHLSLNYLSLTDSDRQTGAAALRELLHLYSDHAERGVREHATGVLSIKSAPINRRLPIPGPVSFGRGLEIELNVDETAFEGFGAFLLGSVLEHFFARYAAINSFTETVLTTVQRGEVIRWPARIGDRHLM